MTREERSIKLIQEFEPKKGYRVGNSGGKDSIVLIDLCKRSKVKYKSFFRFTSVDPQQVRKFLRENHPDTEWIYPKKTMFQFIVDKGLPIRQFPWCCEHLKHNNNRWQVVMTGVRSAESNERSNNRDEIGFHDNCLILNPIYKWSDRQIWEYIKKHNLPYCELYDQGFKRIGCVGCPKATTKNRIKEFEMFPNYKKAYIWSIQKLIDKGLYQEFDNADDVFAWWLAAIKKKTYIERKKQGEFNFT